MAHIDTPKGDLDSSQGYLSLPNEIVITNDNIYKFGTTELYPNFVDSNGIIQTNSAHEYRECSNKGYCNRLSGQCICFDGYEGSACQYLSCPGSNGLMCNGHGICETAKE